MTIRSYAFRNGKRKGERANVWPAVSASEGSDAGKSRWLVASGFMLMSTIALPASAQTGAGAAEEVAADVHLDERDTYRLELLRMRGHLGIARALIQQEAPGAEYHVEALQGVVRSAEATLEDRDAPITEETLRELENAATLDPDQALPTLESAVHAINGSFAQTGALDSGSVLGLTEALLREAVANYTEAVTENEVVDVRKYQTGRGLVTQAEALVRHSGALQGQPGHEELLKVVTVIRQAWPGLMPPPIAFDPASIARRLDEAVAAMEKLR